MGDRNTQTVPEHQTKSHPRRRTVLRVLGSIGLMAIAGCTGSQTADEPTPEPISLDGGKRDDAGGMVIGEHFGPNGQLFYRAHSPSEHDNPAWFHTLTAGLFPYYHEHRRLGWESVAIYVTDYSLVAYSLVDEAGQTYISTHTGADTFGPATEMTFVAGSDVHGGMGTALVPFSDPSEAETFTETHGGSTVGFETITADWLAEYVER